MNHYIALLRGVNVSGHKKIKMADLRDLIAKAGFQNVQTYIQSGNIIFDSSEKDKKIIENKISRVIKEGYEFDVPVLVLKNGYLVFVRKLYKIRNVSFGDIFIFLNALMLRHHFISKK